MALSGVKSRVIAGVLAGSAALGAAQAMRADGQEPPAPPGPTVADYGQILLPETAPPDKPIVQVSIPADPRNDGQHILIQYQGFTVYACALSSTAMHRDACDPQDPSTTTILRTETAGDVKTTISAGTKFDDDTITPEHREVVRFFKSAPLTKRPKWLTSYLNEQQTG